MVTKTTNAYKRLRLYYIIYIVFSKFSLG